MVEIVYNYGRLTVRAADGVVVADVWQGVGRAEMTQVGVEFAPVGAVFATVDVVIEAVELWVVAMYPVEYARAIVAP